MLALRSQNCYIHVYRKLAKRRGFYDFRRIFLVISSAIRGQPGLWFDNFRENIEIT